MLRKFTKFTKIVATISDRRCDEDFLRTLYNNGMNVVRMNSAHIQREGFERIINNTRAVSNNIGILMDTKGPEIRTTTNKDDITLYFNEGYEVRIVGDPKGETTLKRICVSYPNIVADMEVGKSLLIDDGELEFLVERKEDDALVCIAQNTGALGSRKSVNVPGVSINLPSLTERDKQNIKYAVEFGVDFIAHSFVRCKQDILDIQKILDETNSNIKIIAKIENQEGVDNIDEILDAAYGIMIARGDLGIEIPAERIPGVQNMLIRKCISRHSPVIVATQMLHSMINNPRPTRAEVADIANAVYQHTDALMLSGETAYGKYPEEAVNVMAKVAIEAQKSRSYSYRLESNSPKNMDTTEFLAKQAVESSELLGTKAIITDSYTGRTVRYISSFRGKYPTLALCYNEHVIRQLALSYGVFPVYQKRTNTSREYLHNGLSMLIEHNLLTRDNLIAYLGGGFGEGHGTTFLEINNVGEVMDNFGHYALPNLEEVNRWWNS